MIITIPTATITNAPIVTINTCVVIWLFTSIPVGGTKFTSSVALVSLSLNDVMNSPYFGFAFPVTVITSLLPTVFSNFTISPILSNVRLSASSCADTVFVIVNTICVL